MWINDNLYYCNESLFLWHIIETHIIESKVSFDGQKDKIIKSWNLRQLGYWLINLVLLQLQSN